MPARLLHRLVADGRTNREAAAKLVVSVKTIEYHLGNVFGKHCLTLVRQSPRCQV